MTLGIILFFLTSIIGIFYFIINYSQNKSIKKPIIVLLIGFSFLFLAFYDARQIGKKGSIKAKIANDIKAYLPNNTTGNINLTEYEGKLYVEINFENNDRYKDPFLCSEDIFNTLPVLKKINNLLNKKIDYVIFNFFIDFVKPYSAKIKLNDFVESEDYKISLLSSKNKPFYTTHKDITTHINKLNENKIKAEQEYKENLENKRKEYEKKLQEQKIENENNAPKLFHEIRNAYKNNELSADDKYKGNRYTLVGQFDGAEEGGLFNKMLSEIGITIKIMDGNTTCYVFCKFDAATWRDELAKYNKGDKIVFNGRCLSWGSWTDCSLEE